MLLGLRRRRMVRAKAAPTVEERTRGRSAMCPASTVPAVCPPPIDDQSRVASLMRSAR